MSKTSGGPRASRVTTMTRNVIKTIVPSSQQGVRPAPSTATNFTRPLPPTTPQK